MARPLRRRLTDVPAADPVEGEEGRGGFDRQAVAHPGQFGDHQAASVLGQLGQFQAAVADLFGDLARVAFGPGGLRGRNMATCPIRWGVVDC